MPKDDGTSQVIEKFLETKRKIYEIELRALRKVGKLSQAAPFCSFCGVGEDAVGVLIHGGDGARICSECIRQIAGILAADASK